MKAAESSPLGNVREGLLQKHCDGDHLLIVLPFSLYTLAHRMPPAIRDLIMFHQLTCSPRETEVCCCPVLGRLGRVNLKGERLLVLMKCK